MSSMIFEEIGWSRVDISKPAQDAVEAALRASGVHIEEFDVSPWTTAFKAFRHLSEYEGEYRTYAGDLEHCLLEKALEHFISLILIRPQAGMTGIDIGSCKSVLPVLARRVYGVRYFEQDLDYSPGVKGDRIGSSADAIPLPDGTVDFMTLHCTFEHFEGNADIGYVRECARLLRPGGCVVILPLYLNAAHCNVTGETSADRRKSIGWDPDAAHYCVIPEWRNRFGRHYSPGAFVERIHGTAVGCGLRPRLLKIRNWESIHPDLWLRWALVLRR